MIESFHLVQISKYLKINIFVNHNLIFMIFDSSKRTEYHLKVDFYGISTYEVDEFLFYISFKYDLCQKIDEFIQ